MPLDIIRNDITRVPADAIVNTANPLVAIGTGTDQAIYEAAGREQLLAERAKIGEMRPGQAAYTPAFALPAKYIIHTVGPAWQGGGFHERETVAECYRSCLGLAAELGCEKVAFPLISSGNYGFPKDEALKIAISEISSFLFEHDMTVILVVYDKESFVVSGKAFSNVKSFIAENEVRAYSRRREETDYYHRPESAMPKAAAPKKRSRLSNILRRKDTADLYKREDLDLEDSPRTSWDEAFPDIDLDAEYSETAQYGASFDRTEELFSPQSNAFPDSVPSYKELTIDDIIRMKGETFQQVLFKIIDRKGLSDPEVYKKANIDRKLFSKIRSDVDYMPSKKTAMALIIGLELNIDEATDLLQRAGYSFSQASVADLTIQSCIMQHMYDIHTINCFLFDLGQKPLV